MPLQSLQRLPTQRLRQRFDRSDQINQNSRNISVPPRGAGQTGQKVVSLQCRKIRIVVAEASSKSKLCSLSHTLCILGSGNHLLNHSKEMVEPDGIEPTTSCLQSRRSPS